MEEKACTCEGKKSRTKANFFSNQLAKHPISFISLPIVSCFNKKYYHSKNSAGSLARKKKIATA